MSEDINEEIRRLREELDRDPIGTNLGTTESTIASGPSKTISIQDPGGSRVQPDVPVLPGQTVDQVIDIILPKWNYKRSSDRIYELAMAGSGKRITGDLYKAVKNGDKLLLRWVDIGA